MLEELEAIELISAHADKSIKWQITTLGTKYCDCLTWILSKRKFSKLQWNSEKLFDRIYEGNWSTDPICDYYKQKEKVK